MASASGTHGDTHDVRVRAILQTDGGSRGNPGLAGCGFELRVLGAGDLKGAQVLGGGWSIPRATNNVAEYSALIWGLENALRWGVDELEVRADSQLMIMQMIGRYKVKNAELVVLHERALAITARFPYPVHFTHVRREYNKEADRLANAAMDAMGPAGTFLIGFDGSEAPSSALPEVTFAPGPVSVEMPPSRASDACGTQLELPHIQEPEEVFDMYELTVKDHFDAAHALTGHSGQCADLHGHTWDVGVTVEGTQLDDIGILYDFEALKADLKDVLALFDHTYLNDTPPFASMNSTAENMARVIWDEMERRLAAKVEKVHLSEVDIWESPIAKLAYRR